MHTLKALEETMEIVRFKRSVSPHGIIDGLQERHAARWKPWQDEVDAWAEENRAELEALNNDPDVGGNHA